MSVAEELGLEDGRTDLLALAGERWKGWVVVEPVLGSVGGLDDLRSWLRSVDTAVANRVLLALATLGAKDGGDDHAAAGVLAWALVPGASLLANRLRDLSPQVDELVAAQLWIEVRTFPWRRLSKVASNILMNTRIAVLRDCGARSQLERTDATWARCAATDPGSQFWGWYA